jgi:threonine/homoserine/homoserine lactone efflux protein
MLIPLSSGLALGLAAGVAPGPLSALVISQTLNYGVREGIKIAAAPLMTDLPIILSALLVGSGLAARPFPLGILSLLGAVYICYLAWKSLNVAFTDPSSSQSSAKSLTKGILTNLLNPHPWLFWITVGVPLLLKSWTSGPWAAVLWLAGFYLMLVGSKIALAFIAGYSRNFLRGRGYLWLNRIMGLVLFLFALVLVRDGLVLTGIVAG